MVGRVGLQQGPARAARAARRGRSPGPAAGRSARRRAGRRRAGRGRRRPPPPGSGWGSCGPWPPPGWPPGCRSRRRPCAATSARAAVGVGHGVGGEHRDPRARGTARAPPPPPAPRPGRWRPGCPCAPQCGQARAWAWRSRSGGRPGGRSSDAPPARSRCRARSSLAAGPAEHQRRIAPAVEEQQRLLAARRGSRPWPPPAAATASGRAPAGSRAGRSARCPAARAAPWRSASRSQR